ncbi:MAG: Fe-S protein assembly co-chaperone HscB [Thiohalomonadales bacterium]
MSVTSLDITLDYFEIFGLSRQFIIDQNHLSQQFRKIQNVVHPDKYANAADFERRMSVQKSSFVNQAYQTLRDPLERAKYLLTLVGMDLSSDTDTSMDSQFLMQQMELRESLENIDTDSDPLQALMDLDDTLNAAVNELLHEIGNLLNGATETFENSDLHQARDRVRRLQFLSKLQSELSEKEELFL